MILVKDKYLQNKCKRTILILGQMIQYAFIEKKINFDGQELAWFFEVRYDTKLLQSLWNGAHSLDNPLKIPLLNQCLIKTNDNGMFNFNPTISIDQNVLHLAWRSSGISYSSKVDKHGRFAELNHRTNYSFLGLAQISLNKLDRTVISDGIETVLNVEKEEYIYPDKFLDLNEEIDGLEDPRFLPRNSNLLLVHVRHKPNSHFHYSVGIINLESRELFLLNAPHQAEIEKNWVAMQFESDELLILRSTYPYSTLRVNLKTSRFLESTETYEKLGKIHNGTNFLLINSLFYIRLVRIRLSTIGTKKAHFNFLVFHDLDFNEIKRTQPFIFNNIGYEICNSMELKEEQVIFAWGEEDKRIIMGSLPLQNLLQWAQSNLQFTK